MRDESAAWRAQSVSRVAGHISDCHGTPPGLCGRTNRRATGYSQCLGAVGCRATGRWERCLTGFATLSLGGESRGHCLTSVRTAGKLDDASCDAVSSMLKLCRVMFSSSALCVMLSSSWPSYVKGQLPTIYVETGAFACLSSTPKQDTSISSKPGNIVGRRVLTQTIMISSRI